MAKIRLGFVSNSSSSSYIIGVGKLIDETAFDIYCKKNGIDYEVRTTKEILEHKSRWSNVKRVIGNKTYFVQQAFDSNEVSLQIDPYADEKFVSIYHCEDMESNEDGEIDYDIDSNYFNITGQAIFDISKEKSIENWSDIYGAGRNG